MFRAQADGLPVASSCLGLSEKFSCILVSWHSWASAVNVCWSSFVVPDMFFVT